MGFASQLATDGEDPRFDFFACQLADERQLWMFGRGARNSIREIDRSAPVTVTIAHEHERTRTVLGGMKGEAADRPCLG